MKNTEKYYIYGTTKSIGFEMPENGDYTENIEGLGYGLLQDFLKGYYFLTDDNSFLELLCYRHKINKSSLCLLWNYDRELYGFYCENRMDELKCIKDLIEISISLIKYQKIASFLEDASDAKCLNWRLK